MTMVAPRPSAGSFAPAGRSGNDVRVRLRNRDASIKEATHEALVAGQKCLQEVLQLSTRRLAGDEGVHRKSDQRQPFARRSGRAPFSRQQIALPEAQ